MITKVAPFFRSSIFRKQLVAITGLALVGFVILHLAGNFLIFFGPGVFNDYSRLLHVSPELLWTARIVLIVAVIVHIGLTITLTIENRASGGANRYAVNANRGETNFAKKTMILSGVLVFLFLFLHLYDFAIASKTGPSTVLAGREYALYGLVWNAFLNPLRVVIYLAAVWCVGMHLSHGIQSMFQTVGFYHDRYTPIIRKASLAIGVIVAAGFSLIPLYIIARNVLGGPAI